MMLQARESGRQAREARESELDGVAMTTSVSCSAQGDCAISEEGEEELLELSLNDDEDAPLTTPHLTETIKTRARSRTERRPCPTPCRTSARRAWETLFSLDDRLFGVHFLGLLESTHSMMEKVSEVILSEEYGRLKAYEEELRRVIEEVEVGLGQYELQKRGMLRQIDLLRADNDHLTYTIDELHTVIEQLEHSLNQYFEANPPELQKYIPNLDDRPVPFARAFSHSVDELKGIAEGAEPIPAAQFSGFLLDLVRDSQNILDDPSFQSCLLANSLTQSFQQDSSAHRWLTQIATNLTLAAAHSRPPLHFQPVEPSNKVVEAFLGRLSRSRNHLLSSVQSSCNQQLQLWQVIHSSLVTFLGILIGESQRCPLEVSFGDCTRNWTQTLLEELRGLLEESRVELREEEAAYWAGLEGLLWGVHELVAFRMLRAQ